MSNDPSPVDNTTGAHDIPAPGGAGNTAASKTPWYLSYVLWTNVAALLSMLLPSVRDWLASNPIEFATALGAVNALLGFISRGTIQLAGEGGQNGPSVDQPASVLPRPVATGEDATSPAEDRSQDPDQDPSSINHGSESSSPLSGSSRLIIVLGALMLLLGGSCSTDTDPIATSVSLTDGQMVVIRGGSSLVVDRESHSIAWSQSTPDVVVVPPVVQATGK